MPCSITTFYTSKLLSGGGAMQLSLALTGALTVSLLVLSLLPSPSHAHNITHILSGHPDFSTFNHYLSLTHLAAEINRRETITVCAVDNAAMSTLLAKHLPLSTLHNVLSLHVFADYFGAKKLHQIPKSSTLTATLFQATGEAAGTSGYVNITNQKGGRVSFAAVDHTGDLSATFVKSIFELPYNISVIQISHILTSAEAEAPNPSPTLNLTILISKQGCKSFSDLLISSGALDTFNENLDGGLTVFCPSDAALTAFMPKYKNLTAAGKTSLVLYHGVPVYQSMQTLKSSNGLMNTLATDGAEKFDFTVQNDGDDVMLKTKVVTATLTGTVVDKEPLIAYKIDKVLLPAELFKPDKAAPAPKAEKVDAEADAPSPDASDDETADTTNDNGAGRFNGGQLVMAALVLCLGVLGLI
ncbi:Fasciclin-like arabinogalactan protein [Actinidia chinensis var. chinensis]|uniref:Fasciclin-like arabinogalactan protein n=1 Tax=Actinidia chinensis var. chinensis TaxID=1590841 RepID=A0A2R6QWJ1_ACTCC|nr:Fasciclin-like arabinogalactan protein [Actinidia chinensis var. chinensis]